MISERLQKRLAWLTFPVFMGGFVWLAEWGFRRGFPTPTWVITLTILNFVSLVVAEQLLPRKPHANLLSDRQSINDMFHGLFFSALGRPLAAGLSVAMIAVLGDALGAAGLSLRGLWPATWPFPIQLALGLTVWTFMDYWVHRSLHQVDRLWWFHSLHHDTPQMHVLKSGRLHIGEEFYNFLTKPVPLLLLGVPVDVMVWVGLWTIFDGNLVHSNVDQRYPRWAHYFLPTAQLHYLHHAAERRYQDSNYSGSSAIWDLVFGTFHHPDDHLVEKTGIEDSPVPSGFVAQVAAPFRWQIRPPD